MPSPTNLVILMFLALAIQISLASTSSPSLVTRVHQQKRATRQITGPCPRGYHFEVSRCDQGTSTRDWLLTCIPRNSPSTDKIDVPGTCDSTELCVHTSRSGISTAFCVGMEEFVQHTMAEQDKGGIWKAVIRSSSAAYSSSQYTFMAILTDADTRQSLTAPSLLLQAQKVTNVHGNLVWKTLPGGLASCGACASLSVDPVPEGTQGMAVEVMFVAAASAGNLFLGAIEL